MRKRIMKTNSAIERNYQFRQRLNQVHAPNRRNIRAVPTVGEWMIENGGRIIISASASTLIVNAARDLQDYLLTSMQVSVLVIKVGNLAKACKDQRSAIILGTRADLRALGGQVRGRAVIVCGARLAV